jgi:hypothetical protein
LPSAKEQVWRSGELSKVFLPQRCVSPGLPDACDLGSVRELWRGWGRA